VRKLFTANEEFVCCANQIKGAIYLISFKTKTPCEATFPLHADEIFQIQFFNGKVIKK
jgi:hypothetical protein